MVNSVQVWVLRVYPQSQIFFDFGMFEVLIQVMESHSLSCCNLRQAGLMCGRIDVI